MLTILIFLGVIAAYGLWGDIRDDVAPRQTVFTEDARVEVPRARTGCASGTAARRSPATSSSSRALEQWMELRAAIS